MREDIDHCSSKRNSVLVVNTRVHGTEDSRV